MASALWARLTAAKKSWAFPPRASDRLVQGGVEAIWSFAPGRVELPQGVTLKQENLALSLAHLKMQLG